MLYKCTHHKQFGKIEELHIRTTTDTPVLNEKQNTKDRLTTEARRIRAKRWLLITTTLIECCSYYVLTLARYEGQGLTPQFLRFSTRSDIFSNLLFLFQLYLVLRAVLHPVRLSLTRTIISLTLSALILWVTLGVRNFEPGEFPRIASIAYLIGRSGFIALLLPRREYNFSKVSGAIRVVKNTCLVLLTAVLFAFTFSFTYGWTSDIHEIRQFNADAGVILGAAVWHGNDLGDRASPTLLERIKLGYELLKQKAIPKIVVTGSNAPNELAEAEIAKRELIKMGADEALITTETHSRSTLEQVLYLRTELAEKQQWKKFVIISDQYHLARVLEMAKFNGLTAIGSPSNINQNFFDLLFYRLRESVALLAYWLLGK